MSLQMRHSEHHLATEKTRHSDNCYLLKQLEIPLKINIVIKQGQHL